MTELTIEEKQRRLAEIIALQRKISHERNEMSVGTIQKILIEGDSKRSADFLQGRNDQNKMVIFPKGNHQKGDYVNVKITSCSSATLFGEVV